MRKYITLANKNQGFFGGEYCSKYPNYLLSYFHIGIVNLPNGNFDNFGLRPSGLKHLPRNLQSTRILFHPG